MPKKTYPSLGPFVPDSGGNIGTAGLVPYPNAGDAAAQHVLAADGTWIAAAGSTVISTGLASNVSHAHSVVDLPDLLGNADLVLLMRVYGG